MALLRPPAPGLAGPSLFSEVEVSPADLRALVWVKRLKAARERGSAERWGLVQGSSWLTVSSHEVVLLVTLLLRLLLLLELLRPLVLELLMLSWCSQAAGLEERHQLVGQLPQLVKGQLTLSSQDSSDCGWQGLQQLVPHKVITNSHLAGQVLQLPHVERGPSGELDLGDQLIEDLRLALLVELYDRLLQGAKAVGGQHSSIQFGDGCWGK